MSFLIGLLTVILVLDCLLLILLVLIQLPKKEAGAGVAFGGSAADALFGAGTGNVLTKATKYATISLFVLLLLVGFLQNQFHHKSTMEFQKALDEKNKSVLPAAPAAPAATPAASSVPVTPPLMLTNLPATGPAEATPAPVPQK